MARLHRIQYPGAVYHVMNRGGSRKKIFATLEQIGFKVELGGAGLPTNVWATWGSGKPVIAIATEMDSLPEGSQTPGSIPLRRS